MSIEQALLDIAAASASTDALGQPVKIGDETINCVKKSLTIEECNAFEFDGMAVDGIRITVDVGLLGYEPVYGSKLVVEGCKYTVGPIAKIGDNRRITLTRYVG